MVKIEITGDTPLEALASLTAFVSIIPDYHL